MIERPDLHHRLSKIPADKGKLCDPFRVEPSSVKKVRRYMTSLGSTEARLNVT